MNQKARFAVVVLVPLLCAATVSNGQYFGRYRDGVYTAPGKLFRVSSPFPDEATVSDGRERENNNAGAVSFIDSAGRMLGVLYMQDVGGAADTENTDATRALSDWFRDTGFPRFFQESVPDAAVLREAPGQINGNPAWIALAHLPNSSPLGLNVRNSYEVRRNDSWRGMAVVARGKHYYLLQTELRIEMLVGPNWRYDAEAADWNKFMPELEALYQRIQFLK